MNVSPEETFPSEIFRKEFIKESEKFGKDHSTRLFYFGPSVAVKTCCGLTRCVVAATTTTIANTGEAHVSRFLI